MPKGPDLPFSFSLLGLPWTAYSECKCAPYTRPRQSHFLTPPRLLDWLRFAYKQAIRCDPSSLPTYLDAFHKIALAAGPDSQGLMNFYQLERSKGYWSLADRDAAVALLGFGEENGRLRIDFDTSDVDGPFLINAYTSAVTVVNTTAPLAQRDVALKELKEATVVAAQSTGNEELVEYVENELKKRSRDPAEAYAAIGANREMDEDVLLAVFSLRVGFSILFPWLSRCGLTQYGSRLITWQVQDEPGQQARWTEAFETIAEERNSDRLRGFLQTGQDRACISNSWKVHQAHPRPFLR